MTISKRPASRNAADSPAAPAPQKAHRAKKSIYRHQAPEVAAVFAGAGKPGRVAVVAIDYAKKEHRAMIVNGDGEVLRQPFTVTNNAEGVAFLLEAVRTTIKRHAIKPTQVIYGGEDEPAYVTNFLTALAAKKALVTRVNAAQAKDQREGFSASTDDLDLLGIAKCILTRRVTMASPARLADEESRRVLALRELVRGRRRMVFSLTASKNQIHSLADRLFPGFLDEKKSGVLPFGDASLDLMEAGFSAPAVARRRSAGLVTLLCRGGCGETKAREKAAQLLECARSALAPEPSQVAALQESMGSSVRLLRSTMEVIENLTASMAEELSRLPAAFFTTVPGVGVVLASALAAELGPHLHTNSFARQCAYAGIVPRTSQTGGPSQPATQGAPLRRCNRILKDYLVQAASKQQRWGPPEFKAAYAQLKGSGQHADYIIARRLLRTFRALHRQHRPWLPPDLRDENYTKTKTGRAAQSAYYHEMLEKLAVKWRRGPRWTQYFGADRVLGASLRTANSLFGFGLRFPERSAARHRTPAATADTSLSSTCDPDTAEDEPG